MHADEAQLLIDTFLGFAAKGWEKARIVLFVQCVSAVAGKGSVGRLVAAGFEGGEGVAEVAGEVEVGASLLALFQDEPGTARVQELLDQAAGSAPLYLTVVNLGEVLYTVEMRRGLQATLEALGVIDALPIRLADVDRPLALRAARLKATTGMGYADCFAAALADAAVLTGDADFVAVEGSVEVEWLPRPGA